MGQLVRLSIPVAERTLPGKGDLVVAGNSGIKLYAEHRTAANSMFVPYSHLAGSTRIANGETLFFTSRYNFRANGLVSTRAQE